MGAAIREYIENGGLPEAYKYGKPILKTIFGDIVTKDVIRKHEIKTGVIESLAKYLVTNFASEISFNKLKNVFSIKKIQTIKNYVKYFENAYLIFILERFSYKLKQQIIAPKKLYTIDTGIINSISFKFLENIGRLYENIVCTELFRNRKEGTEIYYWKNLQQEEVDFVVKEGAKVRQLIQVCYDIGEYDVKKREVRALLKASKELKCGNLFVITDDKEGS